MIQNLNKYIDITINYDGYLLTLCNSDFHIDSSIMINANLTPTFIKHFKNDLLRIKTS